MSRYVCLVCPETRKMVWLGKAIFLNNNSERVKEFSDTSDELLNKVIWKFFTEHVGKELRILFDYDLEKEDSLPYILIGGDSDGDISFVEYLSS